MITSSSQMERFYKTLIFYYLSNPSRPRWSATAALSVVNEGSSITTNHYLTWHRANMSSNNLPVTTLVAPNTRVAVLTPKGLSLKNALHIH